MIPVLGIPTYNRHDLLLRLLESIDEPVGVLAIVDQGPNPAPWADVLNAVQGVWKRTGHRGVVRRCQHANAGVAAAWNEMITLFPAAWWLLANDDIAFAAGDLARLAEFVDRETGDTNRAMAAAYGNHGASWWAVTRRGIEEVGLFDENFFPAYLEDCDWSYRCDLLGLRRPTVPGLSSRHGDDRLNGSCTVNHDAALAARASAAHGNGFKYYRAKWGGINECETFKTPFNQPVPVWAWRFLPRFRAEQLQVIG